MSDVAAVDEKCAEYLSLTHTSSLEPHQHTAHLLTLPSLNHAKPVIYIGKSGVWTHTKRLELLFTCVVARNPNSLD
jgi:hypothetical protein